jgi:hypothetical protein
VQQQIADCVDVEIFQEYCAVRTDTAEELYGCLQARDFWGNGELGIGSLFGHVLAEVRTWRAGLLGGF